ncbi:MAG: OmpP1/FadL family transporter [Thermoanaerobaculia bacterium]
MRRLALLAVMTLVAFPLLAQNTDIESLSGLQFNFGNPGARSLGMGGAFLGLADDASAAEANPAGLTILRKPEVSIEGRNYLEQQILTTSGTFPDLTQTAFTSFSNRVELTFASVVFPVGGNFTIGAYFHEPLRNTGAGTVPMIDKFTNQFQTAPDPSGGTRINSPVAYVPTGGPAPVTREQCLAIIQQKNDPFACQFVQIKPFVTAVDIRQRTFGVAGAWKLGNFSVGATARYQTLDETSFTFRLPSSDPGPIQFDSISVQATTKGAGFRPTTNHDVTFAAGVKWAPTDKWGFGAVYKKGPRFDTAVFSANADTGISNFSRDASTTFHFPDIYGAGISFRPIPTLTVNADAVRVTYSHLVDDFFSTSDTLAPFANNYKANDVTEIHAGAEYFFPTRIPLAIRGGYWRDPAHSIEWRGPLNDAEQVAAAILFPKGQTQNHVSVGAGLAWQRFQIDAAYDTTDHYKVGSLSVVTRF